ncbi:MAG: hypothetical protein EOP00_04760 [Pedobacter sp.]|nr:MAG: hypothetical protein EOP00_04760 [Pedobacter sp.]
MENYKDKNNPFQFLDLAYMKEISRGDVAYEKSVTKLFIETIPTNLSDLERNFELRSYQNFNKVLHHMQSSISIMGLDKKLAKFMDMDFYEQSNAAEIKENIDYIKFFCNKAIDEAKDYLIILN